MAKKSDMIELESPLVQPAGLAPYTPIVRVQGRLCLDALGRYWPLRRLALAGLVVTALVWLLARLLQGARK